MNYRFSRVKSDCAGQASPAQRSHQSWATSHELAVTNADGTTSVETLAQAGITSIDLVPTGTAADVTLAFNSYVEIVKRAGGHTKFKCHIALAFFAALFLQVGSSFSQTERYGSWVLVNDGTPSSINRLAGSSGILYSYISILDLNEEKNFQFSISCNDRGIFVNFNVHLSALDENQHYRVITNLGSFSTLPQDADNKDFYESTFDRDNIKWKADENFLEKVAKTNDFNIRILSKKKEYSIFYKTTGNKQAVLALKQKCLSLTSRSI